MANISSNLNTIILFVIEYTRSMIDSNYSREEILSSIAKKKFGKVSQFSNTIVSKMNKGNDYYNSIISTNKKIHNKNLKKYFEAMNLEQNADIKPMLDSLETQIMQQKELVYESKIDNVASKAQKTILVMVIPLTMYFYIFLKDVIPEIELVPFALLEKIVFGIVIFLLFGITIMMKKDEY